MKHLPLALFCMVVLSQAQAQLSFGPKAGLNIARISFSSSAFKTKTLISGYGGLFANYQVNSAWAAQLEVVYSGEGTKEESTTSTASGHINEGIIQIPLLAQYHTKFGLYGEAGPQIGILASIKETYQGSTLSIKQYYHSTEFRFPFGVGYEFPETSPVKGLGVNIRYSFGFSAINKVSVGGDKLKNQVISIGAIYKIPMKMMSKKKK